MRRMSEGAHAGQRVPGPVPLCLLGLRLPTVAPALQAWLKVLSTCRADDYRISERQKGEERAYLGGWERARVGGWCVELAALAQN